MLALIHGIISLHCTLCCQRTYVIAVEQSICIMYKCMHNSTGSIRHIDLL